MPHAFFASFLHSSTYPGSSVLALVGDLRKVFCVVCNKTMNLARMGGNALCGNQTSGKEIMKSSFERKGSEDCPKVSAATRSSENADTGSREDTVMSIPPPPTMNPNDVTSGKTVCKIFSKKDVLKPEVLWSLSKNYGHYPYNSNENIEKIFCTVSGQPSSCKVYPLFKKDILSLCFWDSRGI